MMMMRRCYACKSTNLANVLREERREFPGGVTIVVPDVPWCECRACGECVISAQDLMRAEVSVARGLAQQQVISGHGFRYMRKQLGMCRDDVIALCGVTLETVLRWETEAEPVPRATWDLIADRVKALPEGP